MAGNINGSMVRAYKELCNHYDLSNNQKNQPR